MKKTILISILSGALFISAGIFLYVEYSFRVCEKQIMQFENEINIVAEKGHESELLELYKETRQKFENIEIEFSTESKSLEYYKEKNKDDVLIMQTLSELDENPFGSSIRILVKFENIDSAERFENYIIQKANENSNFEIFYLGLGALPGKIREDAKENNSSNFLWKIDYINSSYCKYFDQI